MTREAVIQINKEERGWYLAGYLGNDGWSTEGPFDSLKQAESFIPEYAAGCGFIQYVITWNDE